MGRQIDADKLLQRLDEPLAVTSNPHLNWANKVAHDIMRSMVTEALESAVETAPVVHGRWELGFSEAYQCSICCHWKYHRTNFCPHCGAKMDGGE